MHIPFMCVCIDIVYHIFLQQRHITHQILAIGAIALRHMHLLPCNAFETMLLKTCPRIATLWNPGPDLQVPAIAYSYLPLFFVLMIGQPRITFPLKSGLEAAVPLPIPSR